MSMEKEKISIIVLMYNCENAVGECIRSIINQTYQNWELILVHGASSDNTYEICEKYSNNDSRIRNIVYLDKKGPSPARWRGAIEATGEWMMFLDGDDWLDESCLIDVYNKAIEFNRPDFVFWKFEQIMNDKVIRGKWSFNDDKEYQYYQGDECKELSCQMMNYRAGLGESYAKLIKTEYCKKNNIYPNPNLRQGLEGWEYTLRLSYMADSALFLNRPYYKYRYSPTSLSKISNDSEIDYIHQCLISMFEFCDKMNPHFKNKMKGKLYQRALYTVLAVAMSTYFNPNSTEKYCIRKERFKSALQRCYILKNSLKYADYSAFDKKRKFSIECIKHHLYFPLEIVAKVKYLLIQNGYYNY